MAKSSFSCDLCGLLSLRVAQVLRNWVFSQSDTGWYAINDWCINGGQLTDISPQMWPAGPAHPTKGIHLILRFTCRINTTGLPNRSRRVLDILQFHGWSQYQESISSQMTQSHIFIESRLAIGSCEGNNWWNVSQMRFLWKSQTTNSPNNYSDEIKAADNLHRCVAFEFDLSRGFISKCNITSWFGRDSLSWFGRESVWKIINPYFLTYFRLVKCLCLLAFAKTLSLFTWTLLLDLIEVFSFVAIFLQRLGHFIGWSWPIR